MNCSSNLTKQEYMHLANKVNNNSLCVEYFRKSLFNTSFRGSRDLGRKKTIYKDKNISIKVDRSLNQKHRDLLSLVMYEEKSRIAEDGSYYIKTSLYRLAKKMGYKYPTKDTEKVKVLLEDMQKTLMQVKQGKKEYTHTLLGCSFYDEKDFEYIIQIPAKTAKYHIYSTGVAIPQKYNDKIVAISNNKSRLKALISFIFSNAKLENGMFFDTICNKLDITERTAKSKFKKQVQENLELLKQFKIKFEDDKFYLKKEKCTFYPALSEKQILSFEKSEDQRKYDEVLERLLNTNVDKIITTATQNDRKIFIKNTEEKKLAFYSKNNAFERFLNDDEVRNLVNFIKQNNMI